MKSTPATERIAHSLSNCGRSCHRLVMIAAVLLLTLPESGRAEDSASELPFSRDLINRYSLDHLPRSLSIRCEKNVWIGYDLERAKVYKVWKTAQNEPALKQTGFTVKSTKNALFEDRSEETWRLRRSGETIPLQVRYLGCSHLKNEVELRWELRHGENRLKLVERVPAPSDQPASQVERQLRVEALAENESLIPPPLSAEEWLVRAGKGEDAPEVSGLTGGEWHRITLR